MSDVPQHSPQLRSLPPAHLLRFDLEDRRSFVGGSDARIIMGQDEKALIRLWQEKRGKVGPEDLSTNLIPNSRLVSAGVMAVTRAQEHGYSLLYAG